MPYQITVISCRMLHHAGTTTGAIQSLIAFMPMVFNKIEN